MKGFDPKFKDLPDYIIGITKEIWEDRGLATLHHYYAPDLPMRFPSGLLRGNKAVIAGTMATLAEFPDRQLFGEDVIWSGDEDVGFLSSPSVDDHRHTSGPWLFWATDGQTIHGTGHCRLCGARQRHLR